MKALILGANGYLGEKAAARFRESGADVITLSYRPKTSSEFLEMFREALTSGNPDVVINAGASQRGNDDPESLRDLVDSNVYLPSALASLIRTCSPATCLITFGTSWQLSDSGSVEPFNAYAASKTASEAMLEHFALDGVRIASLRLYDTYGPGDKRKKIVNLIADALIQGTELPMSPGGQLIDLVYIDDVLEAVDAAIECLRSTQHGVHRVYSVRSGNPVTVLGLLETMKYVAGVDSAENIKPGVYAYRTRERFELQHRGECIEGWKPRTKLEDGLKVVLADRRRLINPS